MIIDYATGLASIVKRDPTYTGGTVEAPSFTKEAMTSYNYANDTAEAEIKFGNQTDFGICMHFRTPSRGSWGTNTILRIRDAETNQILLLVQSDTAERINWYHYAASTSSTTYYTQYPANNEWYRVDIQGKIDAVNGFINVYINDNPYLEYTGDTTKTGLVSGIGSIAIGGVDSDEEFYLGGVFVTDGEDTRGIEMFQHQITGEGRFSEMQGSYDALINIAGVNDSSKVIATAANQTQTVQIDTVSDDLDGYEIIAVGVDARVSADFAGANPFTLLIDDGTNVVESATTFTGEGFYKPYKAIFTTAPDGTLWDKTKLENTDIGVRSK